MAVAARDIDITREQLYVWLHEYDSETDGELKDYITDKVTSLNLPDEYVDTSARDDHTPAQVHVVDLIMEDLPSYGYPFS